MAAKESWQLRRPCRPLGGTLPSVLLSRAYLQRWVPGRTFGATFLSDGSSASLLGVCSGRFTKHAGRPFVYAGSLGPVALGEEFTEPMERMGAHVVQQSALKGLFNVDLIIDGEVIWLLEVNPRWSASCELIERAMTDAARLSPRESLIGLVFRGRVNDSPLATPLARLFETNRFLPSERPVRSEPDRRTR